MTEPKYFTIKVLIDNIEPGKLQQILDYYNNNKDVNEAPLQILDRAEGGFKIDIPPEKWVIDDYFRLPNPMFIDENNKNCVYLLLGKHAEESMKFIEDKTRCIVGVHPSPLSANRGFIGSKIFMSVEERLGHGIDWSI